MLANDFYDSDVLSYDIQPVSTDVNCSAAVTVNELLVTAGPLVGDDECVWEYTITTAEGSSTARLTIVWLGF